MRCAGRGGDRDGSFWPRVPWRSPRAPVGQFVSCGAQDTHACVSLLLRRRLRDSCSRYGLLRQSPGKSARSASPTDLSRTRNRLGPLPISLTRPAVRTQRMPSRCTGAREGGGRRAGDRDCLRRGEETSRTHTARCAAAWRARSEHPRFCAGDCLGRFAIVYHGVTPPGPPPSHPKESTPLAHVACRRLSRRFATRYPPRGPRSGRSTTAWPARALAKHEGLRAPAPRCSAGNRRRAPRRAVDPPRGIHLAKSPPLCPRRLLRMPTGLPCRRHGAPHPAPHPPHAPAGLPAARRPGPPAIAARSAAAASSSPAWAPPQRPPRAPPSQAKSGESGRVRRNQAKAAESGEIGRNRPSQAKSGESGRVRRNRRLAPCAARGSAQPVG
jgi:hypothetical protein